jgi:ribosome-interacting GTPase 1
VPTNLPPEYHEVETRYKAATDPQERIALLEELISTIPKHKGTDKLRADFRKRLSKMKSQAQAQKKTSRPDPVWGFDKEGAGQVVVLGCTNTGKSALVQALTNATPEVSSSPFTTWSPTPGMMTYENVPIQLVDTPPLNPDYVEPELMNLVRRADLLLIVVDLQGHPFQQLEDSLEILAQHRVTPLCHADRFADDPKVLSKPILVLVNKNDDENTEEDFQVFIELLEEDYPLVSVSTLSGRNLDYLRQRIFERLEVIRVYSKAPGQDPDKSSPFIADRDCTVGEFAAKIHQDFYRNLKTARVWGHGVYDGQMVSRDHILHDEDVVELRM